MMPIQSMPMQSISWSDSALTVISGGLVILLWCAVLLGTLLSLYLLLLAVASLRGSRGVGQRQSTQSAHFAILIPAHDEELVIDRLLVSVNALDYPRELVQVHVIADHCSDRTAEI